MQFPPPGFASALARVKDYPEWIWYDCDPPANYWMTRYHGRLYSMAVVDGYLDLIENTNAEPRLVRCVNIAPMKEDKMRPAAPLIVMPADSTEALEELVKSMQDNLPAIVMMAVL